MNVYEPTTALPRALLLREDMRAALAVHDFGTVFRLARREAGISYSKIAAECDIKPDRVGTLARGQGAVTTFDKVVRIIDALRVPGHMAGLAARPWERSENTLAPASKGSIRREETRVKRRHFIQATSGAGLAVGLPYLVRPDGVDRLGPYSVELLRRRTARLRCLDEVLGGGDTYPVYLGEYQVTKALVRDSTCTEETRRGLLSVLADQAQQAGWAAFDHGQEAEAAGLYQESYTAALEARDSDLAGNALAFLAYQTLNEDPRAGVEIAARSCEIIGPGAPAGVRALVHERKAWACAVAGLGAETERALNVAEAALEEAAGSPQPDWASWVDRTEFQIMSGRCWAELNRPLRAVPLMETALSRFDDRHARDKSLYLSWLADSYLAAGEVEESATVATQAINLASGVASVRPQRRLAALLKRLSPHRGLALVDAALAAGGV